MIDAGETVYSVRMMLGGLMMYLACSFLFGMTIGKLLEMRNPMKDTEGNPEYEGKHPGALGQVPEEPTRDLGPR